MSDTPRTDAVCPPGTIVEVGPNFDTRTPHVVYILADLSRQLERELAAAQKEIEKWKEEHQFQACLTRDLLPYQERAIKAEAEIAMLRKRNALLEGTIATLTAPVAPLEDIRSIDAARKP